MIDSLYEFVIEIQEKDQKYLTLIQKILYHYDRNDKVWYIHRITGGLPKVAAVRAWLEYNAIYRQPI